jgi:hypothetical protein
MKNDIKVIKPNITARIAGFLYLLLALLGFFGGEYIPYITVSGNAVATVNISWLTQRCFVSVS